jgi:hypothetical protein
LQVFPPLASPVKRFFFFTTKVLVREKPFGYQNTLDLVDIALKEAKLDYLDLVLIQSLPNILALEATSSMKSCLIPPITHRVGELPRLHTLPKGPHATFKADILALDTSKLPISAYIGLLDILSATHGTAKVLENTVPGLLSASSDGCRWFQSLPMETRIRLTGNLEAWKDILRQLSEPLWWKRTM